MRSTNLFILLIFLCFTSAAYPATDYGKVFSEGVEHYNAGRFSEAEKVWLELYNQGYRSGDLLYNIGNACYKQNNISGAILFYERAILLNPASDDISFNLQIARSKLADKFMEIPRPFFAEWFDFVALSAKTDTWAWVSLTAFIILLILTAFFLFTSSMRIRMYAFWLGLLMLLTSIFTISLSLRNRKLVYRNDYAIIQGDPVTGKSSPGEGGEDLFILHDGTKVRTGESVGDYTEVKLPDGNSGWIPSKGFEKI